MRQITIDFDKLTVQGLIDNKYAGYLGEHKSTEVVIIKPADLVGASYSVAFQTNGEVYHSEFFADGEEIRVALWQELTQDNTLYVQLEAYDKSGDYLGKSNVAKLNLGGSVHGVDVVADADNPDVYAEISLNTMFRETLEDNVDTLNKLTTSENGKLLFNGKPIEGSVDSSGGGLTEEQASDLALNTEFRKILEDNADALDKLTLAENGELLFDGQPIKAEGVVESANPYATMAQTIALLLESSEIYVSVESPAVASTETSNFANFMLDIVSGSTVLYAPPESGELTYTDVVNYEPVTISVAAGGIYEFYLDMDIYEVKVNSYVGVGILNFFKSKLLTEYVTEKEIDNKIHHALEEGDFVTNEQLNEKLLSISGLSVEVVDSLPEENINTSTIYLVSSSVNAIKTSLDIFEEDVYNGKGYAENTIYVPAFGEDTEKDGVCITGFIPIVGGNTFTLKNIEYNRDNADCKVYILAYAGATPVTPTADELTTSYEAKWDSEGNLISFRLPTNIGSNKYLRIQASYIGDDSSIVVNEMEDDVYAEYIYVNDKWERIGSTTGDFSGYAKLSDIPAKTSQLTNDSGFIKADNLEFVTPQMFGAVGDGITDDAEAITQALSSGKNVTFDGSKTYLVGSTIVIPENAYVDFGGATIVPNGNFDVIQVKSGSYVENIVVQCSSVLDWDSSAMVLYGGDNFSATNPTKICNVKLYNNTSSTAGLTTLGNGFKLYGDKLGDYLEGVTIEEAMTYGFGNGMLFEGVADDLENPTGTMVFIGANKFRGYWSYKDNCGINMVSRHPNTHITNNIFTDLQIEPRNTPQKENQSSYGIYCNGFANYFDGCLYDYFYEHTAVCFGFASNKNIVKSTSGRINDASWYKDYGTNNTVSVYSSENLNFIPYTITTPRVIGNQDDCFAYIDKRANCTLESFDGNPVSGNLSDVFNPVTRHSLRYRALNPESNNRRARITINCNTAIKRLSNFYLQFHSAPKSVKVTFYNNTDATVVYDTDNNVNKLVSICSAVGYGESYEYNVAKIVIELGGFNVISQNGAETYGEWELVRILGVDSYNTGNTWLKRDGGDMYGDIKFGKDNGIVLTTESGKKFLVSVSENGVLSTSEYTEKEEETPEVAVLTPTMKVGASWYNNESSGVEQSSITSVAFDANYISTGAEDASWACDEDENGNIMAYRNGTEIVIKSTTGSTGVKLNPDSKYMFANDGTNASFSSLTSISGTETWKADKNTSMNYACTKSNITMPIAIPKGVQSLNSAFNECRSLLTPPVLPDGIVSLASAFQKCSAMQYLPEIPNGVTNMSYTFLGCSSATKVPTAIPASVTNMNATFRLCSRIDGTIEINATNITAYTSCFDGACNTSGTIVLTGSCPLLAELAATNVNGKVTVGQ